MARSLRLIVFSTVLAAILAAAAWAEPVKWSAPMEHYPNQWSPTAAPPNYYNNPYGYYYPNYPYYPGYGNAAYGGYPGYGGYYQGAQQGYQRGSASGNPYHPYYSGQQGY